MDAEGRVIAGFERSKCTLMNVNSVEVPLAWAGNPAPPSAGTVVQLRFYFRDAVIYAVGFNSSVAAGAPPMLLM